ncbi:MAG: glutamate--tRNA ligase [Lentisphaeria bacterium]
MSIRVRFAPSPTGKVHIGNIRAAIFNYLFARHNNGKFLLRVEDTDIERSTPEAIEALFEVMKWLDLDYDEEVFYQTSQAEYHLQQAQKLIDQGDAYTFSKGDSGEAVLYRIPFFCDDLDGIKTVGNICIDTHTEVPMKINFSGVSYAQISKKGTPVEAESCLAGLKDLKVYNSDNEEIFSLNENINSILNDSAEFIIESPANISFTRRTVGYNDLVKGELSKPLDSMKDMVIVRSNGTPIFHLSNVIDDITQNITHIIRGDDHVENTYRHILLFQSLGAKAPSYAHLPMIVNSQGRPYSKRDGDAFVGDFREKGFLPHTLFNYLTLLGWSPGNDQEKLSREELISLFTLERVKSTPAQMDFKKLTNLNGQYIAEMPIETFTTKCAEILNSEVTSYFKAVCELMHSRANLMCDCLTWDYFFNEEFEYDEKAVKKNLAKAEIITPLTAAISKFENICEWNCENIDAALKSTALEFEQGEFKLHQPFRIAITGVTNGAGVLEIAELLGKEKTINRLKHSVDSYK